MKNILYVLNTGATGGGILSCIQEGMGLEDFDCKVRFVVPKGEVPAYTTNFSWAGLTRDHLIEFTSKETLKRYVRDELIDICIATIFHTAEIVKYLSEDKGDVLSCYYVQDYEPRFFHEDDLNHKLAKDSYHLGLPAFCKTKYLRDTLKNKENTTLGMVRPSMHSIFNAKGRSVSKKIRILGMYRPSTEYRGGDRILAVFEKLYLNYGSKIELYVFGALPDQCHNLPKHIKSLGVLTSPQVAFAMKSAEVFIDTSLHQGFGRTGLEAMSSGCVPILPEQSGCDEYAQHMQNAILAKAGDVNQLYEGVRKLLDDPTLMHELKVNAIKNAGEYDLRGSCLSIIEYFDSLSSKPIPSKTNHKSIEPPSLIVMPLMMSNGLPTGSGYLRMVYPFLENSNKFVKAVKSYSGKLPFISSASEGNKIAYFQRNGYTCGISELNNWANLWKMAGNKIVLDIDDDLFDFSHLMDRVGHFDKAVATALKVKAIATLSDLVTCSTDWLANRTMQYNSNVMVVPNRLSNKCWSFNPPKADKAINSQVFKIGYVGTPTHDRDLEIVAGPIKKLLAEEKGFVEFEVIGAYQNVDPPFGKKIWLPQRTEYPLFVEWLHKAQDWDIGLIPLADDDFNKSKSNLKFLEYAALSVPIICSAVQSYKNIAVNMKNCIVVDNSPDSWYNAIYLLKNNSELRKELVARAKSDVMEHYILEKNGDAVIEDILRGLE